MRNHANGLRVVVRMVADATIIGLDGEIDLATAEIFTDAVAEAGGDGPVVADLSGVTFMDSSGMRSLFEAERLTTECGRRFAIAYPSPPVARLLELTDLRQHFTELADTTPQHVTRLSSE